MVDDISQQTEAGKPPFRPGPVQTFSCPNCGGTIGIRALGITIHAVCESCGSIVDVSDENLRIIETAAVKARASEIPIGSRGKLFDTEWEVIGYMIRSDSSGLHLWREYLLFNPYQGFRFLTEANGHWNFVKTIRVALKAGNTSSLVEMDERQYRLFERGRAVVRYVMGEFYWRVSVGEDTAVSDYVAPPHILSKESSEGDILWAKGVYLPYGEISAAFDLKELPAPVGIAPNQPSPYSGKLGQIVSVFLIAGGLLLMAQLILNHNAADRVVFERQLQVPATARDQLLISEPITLTGGPANAVVVARSNVSNNWVELDTTLSNDTTDASESATLPIEFYSGADSDGPWSEGEQVAEVAFSSVPDGQYHLQVEADAGAFAQGKPIDLQVKVIRDAPVWTNFWLTLLFLIPYPAWALIRHWMFVMRQWSESSIGYTFTGTGAK